MSVVLFDTYAFVKRLTAAGMPEAQAEVLADHQARLIDERLAARADIADLAAGMPEIFTRMAGFATKSEVADAKVEILKLLVYGALGFQTIVVLGAVVALSRFGL